MKTIPLAEAFNILLGAAGVLIDNHTALIGFDRIRNKPDNQFAHLSWYDNDNEYAIIFSEEHNQTVKVHGSKMLLVDDEGDPTELTIPYCN